MDFLDKSIQDYAERHSAAEPQHLYELNRYTHTNVLKPRMLSGHLQGRFLAMMSHLMQPEFILDIGTYTGYSALCLAEGLKPGGLVHTIEANEEVAAMAAAHIASSPYKDKVSLHVGDALEQIKSINDMVPQWDMVWIDAEKSEYDTYFELCISRVRKGGLIMADNVLWSGKVCDEKSLNVDKDTQYLHAFNNKVCSDNRVENLLLPIRDGIMMMRVL